ncbi:hypothetical protein [Stenotrophomonas sp. CFBP 13718]|uniref:hypothetical protein n=1 Tax=Stenotrophomonas sp. CFBP 13718 TaxID=2775304 RepID=UPI00178755F2|nr:hypothetical protein [Stenotrophomonas sp. CFBP 13718]MBD8696753.1 hypothetical protein [Stenotrophomonas sp. CFBP 13718]
MSALLLVLLLGLMLTVPSWTLNRFRKAKAAWLRVLTGERYGRTYGRFVIHAALFGVGVTFLGMVAAVGTVGAWPVGLFLLVVGLGACIVARGARQ